MAPRAFNEGRRLCAINMEETYVAVTVRWKIPKCEIHPDARDWDVCKCEHKVRNHSVLSGCILCAEEQIRKLNVPNIGFYDE